MDALQDAFKKNKVLDMQALQAAIKSSAPATVHRYLKQIDYITSYTHNGKYYTLPEIAQFDKDGFWHYKDIGFSIRGTLIDTLAYIIPISSSGQTNSELEKQFRIRVQESLRTLLESERIARKKVVNHNLYLNPDPAIAQQQIENRQKTCNRRKLPPFVLAEILLAVINTLSGIPDIDTVMKYLKKETPLLQEKKSSKFLKKKG